MRALQEPRERDFWLALLDLDVVEDNHVCIVQRHVQRLFDDGRLPAISTVFAISRSAIDAAFMVDADMSALGLTPMPVALAVVAAVEASVASRRSV